MSLRLTLGLTESSPDANLKTIGSCKGFESCLDKLPVRWGRLSLSCARDWANTKAAYRFFSNERVDEGAILSGHFQATRDRVAKIGGQVLVLHDTTEFTYKRDKPHLVGVTR